MAGFAVREKDGSGRVIAVYSTSNGAQLKEAAHGHPKKASSRGGSWRRLLGDVFLPEGYPHTVSSDYLQYQIWNALQAFCSSLAGLFASRAVLQGHGVGNASASATNAIFLTVLQDVFSRLTTIVAGYYLGTSLYPEAKTYRLLADVLNDAAIICDTLSPHLAHVSFSVTYPFLVPVADSPLRVVALCLSGAFRALCGAVAGGSKAALTVHFATAGEKPGDVGDLSAKDGSKETVLALLGMLCGSVVLHYVHDARTTYAVLFSLIFCHLAANFVAVRVIAMRAFNRQRASIAWVEFRASYDGECKSFQIIYMSLTNLIDEGNTNLTPTVLSYVSVACRERIFMDSSCIPCSQPGRTWCSLGVPFSALVDPAAVPPATLALFSSSRVDRQQLNDDQIAALLELFSGENYILWFTSDYPLSHPSPANGLSLAVVLKDSHGPIDHLKAWAHAHELARLHGSSQSGRALGGFDAQLAGVRDALGRVSRMFPQFVVQARAAGWKTEESVLVGGSPVTIAVDVGEAALEVRKDI
ncbi:vitamin B6 photo-protection and homoeostasis-domain-containing protein [Trametes maxima]|nr:vitamin B6 photo-protection and homoeostasis-domain-containing protein [Trametes maxima]